MGVAQPSATLAHHLVVWTREEERWDRWLAVTSWLEFVGVGVSHRDRHGGRDQGESLAELFDWSCMREEERW